MSAPQEAIACCIRASKNPLKMARVSKTLRGLQKRLLNVSSQAFREAQALQARMSQDLTAQRNILQTASNSPVDPDMQCLMPSSPCGLTARPFQRLPDHALCASPKSLAVFVYGNMTAPS